MTDKQIAVKVDHVSKYFKLPTEATNMSSNCPGQSLQRNQRLQRATRPQGHFF